MDDRKIEFSGDSCGQHGPYTFFRSVRYTSNRGWSSLRLGQFFNATIARVVKSSGSKESLSAVGELQLLWLDRNHKGIKLASVRLYLRPEDTPTGRLSKHGQIGTVAALTEGRKCFRGKMVGWRRLAAADEEMDGYRPGLWKADEILALDEKLVLRVDDLLQWVVANDDSRPPDDNKHADGEFQSTHLHGGGLEGRSTGPVTNHCQQSPENCVILSYPRYCRHRAFVRRLESFPMLDTISTRLLAAIGRGGEQLYHGSMRVLFCRDTVLHPGLQKHAFCLDHLAPVLKGRKRKRKSMTKAVESEESIESETSSEKNSGSTIATSDLPSPVKDESPLPACSEDIVLNTDNEQVEQTVEQTVEQAEQKQFLKKLYDYMRQKRTPIGRIPTLGFQKVDLYRLYQDVQNLGGYEGVMKKRLWKLVYDQMGGCSSNTSAATGTRKTYERLLLPFEKCLQAEQNKKSPAVRSKSAVKSKKVKKPKFDADMSDAIESVASKPKNKKTNRCKTSKSPNSHKRKESSCLPAASLSEENSSQNDELMDIQVNEELSRDSSSTEFSQHELDLQVDDKEPFPVESLPLVSDGTPCIEQQMLPAGLPESTENVEPDVVEKAERETEEPKLNGCSTQSEDGKMEVPFTAFTHLHTTESSQHTSTSDRCNTLSQQNGNVNGSSDVKLPTDRLYDPSAVPTVCQDAAKTLDAIEKSFSQEDNSYSSENSSNDFCATVVRAEKPVPVAVNWLTGTSCSVKTAGSFNHSSTSFLGDRLFDRHHKRASPDDSISGWKPVFPISGSLSSSHVHRADRTLVPHATETVSPTSHNGLFLSASSTNSGASPTLHFNRSSLSGSTTSRNVSEERISKISESSRVHSSPHRSVRAGLTWFPSKMCDIPNDSNVKHHASGRSLNARSVTSPSGSMDALSSPIKQFIDYVGNNGGRSSSSSSNSYLRDREELSCERYDTARNYQLSSTRQSETTVVAEAPLDLSVKRCERRTPAKVSTPVAELWSPAADSEQPLDLSKPSLPQRRNDRLHNDVPSASNHSRHRAAPSSAEKQSIAVRDFESYRNRLMSGGHHVNSPHSNCSSTVSPVQPHVSSPVVRHSPSHHSPLNPASLLPPSSHLYPSPFSMLPSTGALSSGLPLSFYQSLLSPLPTSAAGRQLLESSLLFPSISSYFHSAGGRIS